MASTLKLSTPRRAGAPIVTRRAGAYIPQSNSTPGRRNDCQQTIFERSRRVLSKVFQLFVRLQKWSHEGATSAVVTCVQGCRFVYFWECPGTPNNFETLTLSL